MIECRHGLLLSLPHYIDEESMYKLFKNYPPTKERTFLVIQHDKSTNELILLNVASDEGDKKRLMFDDRYVSIYPFKPPFNRLSFARVDSVYFIEYFQELESAVLHEGGLLDEGQFKKIINQISQTSHVRFTKSDLLSCNNF
ncbi:hypothetical protein MmiAt1_02910 [Methanimicrococcus sp. At1]|uniref:Uncharacterized protein n=1 Tax=Methanimicrococcus hacksteinii TaxID=3028293 RepID=A0ABU3VMW4_9EURY|nr:hypothetical protein [Methanimicrococcus sp. At1]MDV0444754.1 hypothetical protein [Methanimicrococcus sp. At1]